MPARRFAFLALLSMLGLAACASSNPPPAATGLTPAQKPALAAPPSSLMTPPGY
ncbi:hypothetical protein [Rhizosaccharibacter radicis]|uniref:Uncharacterized protein n=1 Tax=Rhizosaccharibacter radicis TaxID=2782605 RepID=A0ABT1VWH5_9PROT|nr:hypothetical protein [Acetobacteraceae bacterium KSS12]